MSETPFHVVLHVRYVADLGNVEVDRVEPFSPELGFDEMMRRLSLGHVLGAQLSVAKPEEAP